MTRKPASTSTGDANGDGGGIIRTEGDKVVMAEMKGPGCIWRIWSAAAEKGHVKIYLDDQPKAGRRPAVRRLFRRQARPVHLSRRCPTTWRRRSSSGQNLYLPIPYQKSCKVVADKGWGNYYHFNYATYPGRHQAADLQRRPGRRACRASCRRRTTSSPSDLGDDPAGKRPGRRRSRSRCTSPPGQTARWPSLTARERSPRCG